MFLVVAAGGWLIRLICRLLLPVAFEWCLIVICVVCLFVVCCYLLVRGLVWFCFVLICVIVFGLFSLFACGVPGFAVGLLDEMWLFMLVLRVDIGWYVGL